MMNYLHVKGFVLFTLAHGICRGIEYLLPKKCFVRDTEFLELAPPRSP